MMLMAVRVMVIFAMAIRLQIECKLNCGFQVGLYSYVIDQPLGSITHVDTLDQVTDQILADKGFFL